MHTHKLFATLLILISCSLQAATLQGKVVSVADGDTIKVLDATNTQHKIRLQGIDAPEKAQAFGQKSKQSLYRLAHNKQATVEFQKKDKYGRTVGKVLLPAVFLSRLSFRWFHFCHVNSLKLCRPMRRCFPGCYYTYSVVVNLVFFNLQSPFLSVLCPEDADRKFCPKEQEGYQNS